MDGWMACMLSSVWPFVTPWYSTRLLCPWSFPGKDAGVGCHFLLQGIFLTQELNSCLSHLLHWQADSQYYKRHSSNKLISCSMTLIFLTLPQFCRLRTQGVMHHLLWVYCFSPSVSCLRFIMCCTDEVYAHALIARWFVQSTFSGLSPKLRQSSRLWEHSDKT